MLKNDNKKGTKEFIEYLKDAPLNSNIKRAQSKYVEAQKTKDCKQIKYYGPIQGDFSKISSQYVLENNRLRKKSAEYNKNNIKKQKQNEQTIDSSQSTQQNPQIQLIKQKTKLEYLQKKGFLRPQEKARLQKIKNQKESFNMMKEPMHIISSKSTIKEPIHYQQEIPIYQKNVGHNKFYMKPMNNENFNPNYHMQHQYIGDKNIDTNQNYYPHPSYGNKMTEQTNNRYHPNQNPNRIIQNYENMQSAPQMCYSKNDEYEEYHEDSQQNYHY